MTRITVLDLIDVGAIHALQSETDIGADLEVRATRVDRGRVGLSELIRRDRVSEREDVTGVVGEDGAVAGASRNRLRRGDGGGGHDGEKSGGGGGGAEHDGGGSEKRLMGLVKRREKREVVKTVKWGENSALFQSVRAWNDGLNGGKNVFVKRRKKQNKVMR